MLSTSEYTYNGKEKKPSVMVKDKKGNVLKKGTDYTVSYESGRKQPGSYAVKVTLKGKYSGSKTVYYKIKPKTPTNLKATRTTSTVTLSWGKVTGADGYRVYLYNENTKKYEKLKNVSGTSTKITGLKPCATYKYKVRAYAKDDETAWSSYSAVIAPAVKKAHTNKVTITDAKLTANGKKVTKCSTCGTKSTETIYSPETIKLSSNKYTYNGKVRTPSITVTDAKGKKLVKDRDYTVFYESGRKNPGRYTVKIKFKGNYTGTKSLTFVIKPKTPASLSAKKTTSSITLSWGKVTGASGYRIYKYNTSTKKYEALKDVSGTSYKIKGLTADTTYKFKVRAYKNDADGTIWGSYSGVFETATK